MAKALVLAALLGLAGAARGDLDSSLVSKLRAGGYVLYPAAAQPHREGPC
jgi:hypothetical protein